MWWFISLIILLDGILVYYFPFYLNDLSYWYPMLTVSLISIIYSYYKYKKYYYVSFIIGVIYDLLYSNIFLYHALLFLLLAKINSKLYKIFKDNFLFKVILIILNIIFYDTISFLVVKFSHYVNVDIMDLVYKITHSILLNIMIVFVDYFLFKKKHSKHIV